MRAAHTAHVRDGCTVLLSGPYCMEVRMLYCLLPQLWQQKQRMADWRAGVVFAGWLHGWMLEESGE